MENCIEVIRQALELSSTIGEGLEHINAKFEAGLYEDALALFQDVVQAFISIQHAIENITIQFPSNHLESLFDVVQNSLDSVVTDIEQKNWGLVSVTMQNQLLPAYIKWKEELENVFRLLITS